ncbi:MAG: hypothetical protein R2704_15870 [Microthrixaceae bacterium]
MTLRPASAVAALLVGMVAGALGLGAFLAAGSVAGRPRTAADHR